MCISPDYNVLMDTTWVTFERVARQLGKWIRGIKTPQPQVWFRTEDGGVAHCIFKSAEKPEKLRGPNKSGIWFDEASIMTELAFHIAIMVLREEGVLGPELYTFTPKGRKHWTFGLFYAECNEDELEILDSETPELIGDLDCYDRICGKWYRKQPGTSLVRAHSRENPFLPPNYESLGSHLTSGMRAQELGGEFIDLEGLLFQREWFYPLVDRDRVPRKAVRIRSWDRAATPGGGCFSAGALMARDQNGIYWIEDVVRGQWSADERNRVMMETARRDAERYNNEVLIYAEQEGGSAGKEISQQYLKMMTGFPAYVDIVSGQRHKMKDNIQIPGEAKLTRAMPMAAQAEAGNIRMVRGSWTEECLTELSAFGESDEMDQVDALSSAFNNLNKRWTVTPSSSRRLPNAADPSKFGRRFERPGEVKGRGTG